MIEVLGQEFAGVSLGNKKLNKRLVEMSAALAMKGGSKVSSAMPTWKEIKGAYRLLSNDLVTPEKILTPHIHETVVRCNNEKIILAVQDTTFLDFLNRPKTEGLDLLQRKSKTSTGTTGLILHNMLALNEKGCPLGLLNQEFIDRKIFREGKATKNLPLEEKESFRWVKNLRLKTLDRINAKIVHIADREADFFEFFEAAQKANESFVVRAAVNRSLEIEPGNLEKLFDHTKSQNPLGKIAIKIQSKPDGKDRIAHLEIKSSMVQLEVPWDLKKNKNHKKLSLYCVAAIELHVPKGFEEITWYLLTDIPVQNFEQACEKFTWYTHRWNVEVFHKILKSGCKVEELQLRTGSALKNMITIQSIIAWFLFWLRKLNISSPQMSCEELVSDGDWRLLYKKLYKTNYRHDSPPTIRDFLLWIGKLGGFIGRKSDGMPGVKAIWQGFHRYMQLLEDYYDLVGNA